MIGHDELGALFTRGADMMGEGAGLGGRIEAGCLATEANRCAATFLSEGERNVGDQDFRERLSRLPSPDGLTPVQRTVAANEVARALVIGLAAGFAHAERRPAGTLTVPVDDGLALDRILDSLQHTFGLVETHSGAWTERERAALAEALREGASS